MRPRIIAALTLCALVGWDTIAQVDPPWIDNLVYELERDQPDSELVLSALTDVHFSLVDGEPCNPSGYPADVIELLLELCDVVGIAEVDGVSQIDGATLQVILEELANTVEIPELPDEWTRR